MIGKVIEELKKEERKRIDQLGKVWGFPKHYSTFGEFLEFLTEYFGLNIESESYKFDSLSEYSKQFNFQL